MYHFSDLRAIRHLLRYLFVKKPFYIYLLFFAVYFSPFLIARVLPGNLDTILHASIFNEYILKIRAFIGLGVSGYSFYPVAGANYFTENMFGQFAIYGIAKLFTLSDSSAFYIVVIAIFSLNAYTVNKLVLYLTNQVRAAFIFGLFFAASCFMLSNMEYLNGVSFFFVPLSLLYLLQYFKEEQHKFLYWSFVCIGLQSLFSGYFFALGLFINALFFLNYTIKLKRRIPFIQLIVGLLILAFFAAPTIYKVIINNGLELYNPADHHERYTQLFSFDIYAFTQSLERNLLYGSFRSDRLIPINANTGILIILLFIVGIVYQIKKIRIWIAVAFFFFLLSVKGIHIESIGVQIPSLYSILFSWNFVSEYIRLPYRFYTLSLLCITVVASFGYVHLESKLKNKNIFCFLILSILLLENVSYKVFVPDHDLLLNQPSIYQDIASLKEDEIPIILNLPSSLFSPLADEMEKSELRREFIYMYWQTKHKKNILNGCASYYPSSRIKNNELIQDMLDSKGSIPTLIEDNQIDYFIFHKDLVYHSNELLILTQLKKDSNLLLVEENETKALFEVIDK